eukprot:5199711-Pyramimonas_sp.AAC.1
MPAQAVEARLGRREQTPGPAFMLVRGRFFKFCAPQRLQDVLHSSLVLASLVSNLWVHACQAL